MNDKELSQERKKLQEKGLLPVWFTTGGWQMFKQRYLYQTDNAKQQYERIATTLAKHIGNNYPLWWYEVYGDKTWSEVFFDVMWKGDLSPSTPVLSNTGTNRGLPVSCAGNEIADEVFSFYDKLKECAVLTQEGFGTASYLGHIRCRGTAISRGGKAMGVLPVFKMFVQMSQDISQGSTRRGAWAGYLEITHGDFDEICDHISELPDGVNVGWIITDDFKDKLLAKDAEAMRRWGKLWKTKMVTGKGYLLFIDKVNRNVPQMYKDKGMKVKTSQLCSEISLYSDLEHTFTCVLSSLNCSTYRTWSPKLAFISTVFLDAVVSEFLEKGKHIRGLECAVRFTEKSRALGLGLMGLSTLFQKERIVFGSMDSMYLQNDIMTQLDTESKEASKWLAEVFGEPEWCKGYGVRNTHRLAIAPTKSTALIMSGASEGINIDPKATYTQLTAAGEVDRISPVLLEVMKERGVNDKKHIQEIIDNYGSVMNVSWLDDNEKDVFRNAFETPQESVLVLAAQRQRKLDQMQSLNLFFDGSEDENYIGEIALKALLDENIQAIYYAYSSRGVTASKDCVSCG